jgi:hypothetical protein
VCTGGEKVGIRGILFDREGRCIKVDGMTMNTLYYVVLMRPQGSKTWMPAGVRWMGTMNFFANEEKARARCVELCGRNDEVWLEGAQEWVPSEYAVGRVTLCADA